MFSKVFQLSRIFDPHVGKLHRVTQSAFTANRINKRNAGHSEWANRKSAREASSNKKSSLLVRFRTQIIQAVIKEKSANPAVNPRLQAVLAEAKKASIPQSTIEKLIKPLAASLNQDSIISFTFSHSMGINCVVDISSIQPVYARAQVTSIMKKYGFKYDGDAAQIHKMIGIIYGKKSENVENAYDKAVEDAITTNCEEVTQDDDGNFSFFCHPQNLEACTKSLSNLGYKIDYSETQYQFPTYVNINEAITARLEEMEDKLGKIPGFVKITLNAE